MRRMRASAPLDRKQTDLSTSPCRLSRRHSLSLPSIGLSLLSSTLAMPFLRFRGDARFFALCHVREGEKEACLCS